MKKIPWWQPYIGKKEHRLINEVLKSNFPNEGIKTEEFEKKLAEALHVKHVVAVNNATSAMYLSLKALGIGFGDEVIVPDVSFIATANAVEMTGAKAVLVDVDPNTLFVDINSAKKAITAKTKAVIPVHVSGRPGDILRIIKLAKEKNLFVIEDAAEALMSKLGTKFLGTFGETGCFSLSPAKTITTGQGGYIATNNTRIYLRLRELKDQGRKKRGTGGDDIHYSLGFNFKFTDLQAAVGLGQLDYLEKRVRRMKRNSKLYKKYLSGVNEINLYEADIDAGVVQQWVDAKAKDRNKLIKFLLKHKIDCRPFWYPIHKQAYYKKSDKDFPNSSKELPKSLWLPSSFMMGDKDVYQVCKKIKEFYATKKR